MASPLTNNATRLTASSIPVTASAGVVTAANAVHGFRSTCSVTASIPRFFAKMASLGYISTKSEPLTSPIPVVAAFTTNNTMAPTSSQVTGNATASPSLLSGTFDGGMHSIGGILSYVISKWAVLYLFMVAFSHQWFWVYGID
jgi:hypothetical protein